MSGQRRIFAVALLAVLGIALAAAITWGTSQLVRQHIGLSSDPISAGRHLPPSSLTGVAPPRQTTTVRTRTVTTTVPAPASPMPSQTQTSPPSEPPPASRTPAQTAAPAPAGGSGSDSTSRSNDSARRDD